MKVHNFLGTKMSTFRVNLQNCEILAPRKYGRTCSEPVFTHTHTHTHTHTLSSRYSAVETVGQSSEMFISTPHTVGGTRFHGGVWDAYGSQTAMG